MSSKDLSKNAIKSYAERMLDALEHYGFFIIDSSLEDAKPFYQVLLSANVAKYFRSTSVSNRFVVLSLNKDICKFKCKENCGSDDQCIEQCIASCLRELKENVEAALKELAVS